VFELEELVKELEAGGGKRKKVAAIANDNVKYLIIII
jgi:hypothetical protein